MIQLASPNRDDRPEDARISMLVLHYTGMKTPEEAIARLCDRDAKVSVHYVVDDAGQVYQLVAEEDRAWHAGQSFWRGRERLNDVSIGIEITNPGHEFGYRPFPDAQMRALLPLCQQIVARHRIRPTHVVGHSDIAPTRKEDPGELFDWAWLAEHGIGLWPGTPPDNRQGWEAITSSITSLQQRLSSFGYGVEVTGELDDVTEAVILAFQRHYRQTLLTGYWDGDCDWRLERLLACGA